MKSQIKVNLSFDVPFDEQRRICMEFLAHRFRLNEVWENDEIIRIDYHYHGDTEMKVPIGKVTEEMRMAKVIYEQLRRDIK